jgi:hypothetical protein
MYFPYLFPIWIPGPPYLQINTHDTYNLRFRCSLYAWKNKEIIFSMKLVTWSTKFRVTHNHRIISSSNNHRNAIFPFYKMSSLPPPCTHKHKIISLHNTLMTNISITYISLPFLCLISLFLSNLSKSCLFISHIFLIRSPGPHCLQINA